MFIVFRFYLIGFYNCEGFLKVIVKLFIFLIGFYIIITNIGFITEVSE